MALSFNAHIKRLVVPLIIVALVCAACSTAVNEPGTTLPGAEASAAVPDQQPSAMPEESGEAAPNTDIEIDVGSPLEPPASGEPSEQRDQGPATPQDTVKPPENQDNALTADSSSAAPSPPTGNGSAAPSTTADNSSAVAPPVESSSAPPSSPAGSSSDPPSSPAESNAAASPSAGNSSSAAAPPTESSSATAASPAENSSIEPTTPAEGPVVLTISGDGVNGATTWTLGQLQALKDGYRELTYSTTNNWPSFEHIEAHGVSIPYLLRQAGLRNSATSIKFISTDGYFATLTYSQVFGARYSYAKHSSAGSSGASTVEPVIAWDWGNVGKTRPENIRPFFGQSGPWEVNSASFVKNLCKIEVSATSAGTWAPPGASIADGSTVPAGTELELSHGNMDSIRIYYTLDGSEPGYNSTVYNKSASYFQPQLIGPLILTESVTVKAFAAGLGKERSPTVTLAIAVE